MKTHSKNWSCLMTSTHLPLLATLVLGTSSPAWAQSDANGSTPQVQASASQSSIAVAPVQAAQLQQTALSRDVVQTQAASSEHGATHVQIGDVTRSLLAAQVDGNAAGAPLPVLGATASASWQRYLDSFNHKIPPFFDTKMQSGSSSGAR